MGRAVGVTLERDGWHGDERALAEPSLQVVAFSLALGQPQPPAVVVE
jgi:hypothetical protein